MAQLVKNQPAMQETWVGFLAWEDPLEKEMATHSSIVAWRVPMDRGARWATVHGVAKSQTQLSDPAHTRGSMTKHNHGFMHQRESENAPIHLLHLVDYKTLKFLKLLTLEKRSAAKNQ